VIGIIMPELNVLPVSVSQNRELKDELVSFGSTTSKDDFSKYIDLHLNKNNELEKKSHVDPIKSETNNSEKNHSEKSNLAVNAKPSDTSLSGTVPSETLSSKKITGDSPERHVPKENKDSTPDIQKVAASGNKDETTPTEIDQKSLLESEQLISFLSKAEKTLINKPSDNSGSNSPSSGSLESLALNKQLSSEQISTEQNAHYETQLLLNGSSLVSDLSAVAKALGDDKTDKVSSSLLFEQSDAAQVLLLNKTVLNNTVVDETPEKINTELGEKVNQATLLVESSVKGNVKDNIEGENKENIKTAVDANLVKSAESKEVMVEQENKVKANVETNINNISSNASNQTNAELPDIKVETAKQISNQGILTEPLIDSDGAPKLATKNNENVTPILDQNSLSKDATQQQEAEILNRSQVANANQFSENKQVESAIKDQSLFNGVKPLDKMTEPKSSTTKAIESDSSADLSVSESVPEITEDELIPTQVLQSTEVAAANEKTAQVATLNKNVSSVNQSTANDLMKDDMNKAQAKESGKAQLSNTLDEHSEQESIIQNEETEIVAAKVAGHTTRESVVNSHFIDVSGTATQATQTTQDISEQQLTERVNASAASEVTQNQKLNAQLHQETISLFRKDFTEAVQDKVMLMISQKLQRFDITLDPPELGNMQVRVNLQGEQAVVNFVVQSQQTKDALEQNMHKLRESLAEQGVNVGDANVEQQSQQSANGDGADSRDSNQSHNEMDNISEANDVITQTLSAQKIDSSTASVDYYA
jgi:flagellar hook-length control protein FliK